MTLVLFSIKSHSFNKSICRSNHYWWNRTQKRHMGLNANIPIQIWPEYKVYHWRVIKITENGCLCIQDFLAPSRCSLNERSTLPLPSVPTLHWWGHASRGSSQCCEVGSAAFLQLLKPKGPWFLFLIKH